MYPTAPKRIFNVAAARAGGMSDEEIQAYLAKNPNIRPSQALVQQNSSLADYLPMAAGAIGGIGGGIIGGPAGAIIGSGAGQALGEFGRQAFKGEQIDPMKIAGEGAWGLATGGAGEALGLAARAGGKLLLKGGEELAMKGFRPSPTALREFAATGEQFPEFLMRNKLAGAGVEQIADQAKVAQDVYDNLVATAGTKISGKQYSGALLNEASKYANADDPTIRAIGEKIFDQALFIEKKYGNRMIPATELRAQRIMTDQALPKNAFMNSPVESGVSGVVRQTQKNLIDEVADTGAAGKELQKYYKALDIADKGQYKGRGNQPIGLTSTLGAAAGGAAAGPAGLVGGYLVPQIINNPRVMGAEARLLAGAGNTLANPIVSRVGGQTITRVPSLAVFNGGVGNNNENSNSPTQGSLPSGDMPNNKGIIPPTATSSQGAGNGDIYDPIRQKLILAMIQDYQTTGGKNLAKIKAGLDIINAVSPQQQKKPMTEAQQARVQVGQLTDIALRQLQGGGVKTGFVFGPLEDVKGIFGKGDQATLNFHNTIVQIKGAIAKARAGTSFTPNEEKLLNKYTPNEGDSMQMLVTKLNGLQQVFSGAANDYMAPELPQVPQNAYYQANNTM